MRQTDRQAGRKAGRHSTSQPVCQSCLWDELFSISNHCIHLFAFTSLQADLISFSKYYNYVITITNVLVLEMFSYNFHIFSHDPGPAPWAIANIRSKMHRSASDGSGLLQDILEKEQEERTRALINDLVIEGDKQSTHILNMGCPIYTCSIPFSEYISKLVSTKLNWKKPS